MSGHHHQIQLHCHPLGILNTFILEQYVYKAGRRTVEVLPGETVIDAGGCWGDTALYFSDRVGPKGKVFCFEILDENLRILRQNLELNQHCAASIEVVRKALWNTSNELLSLCGSGPGTSIAKAKPQSTGLQIATVSIDDFVADAKLNRLDFIKMDIEGAELMALQGAEKALRRFKPKLGISVYHNYDDIFTIPLYLKSLDLGYEFFLDHFTIHREETVLFAIVRS
jgi:FkbM family methyltransferase